MARATVDEIAATLYQVTPEEFVASRDLRVKELRASGERDVAAQVAKLRKPAVSAWLVNLLVADAPDLRTQLSELAEQLRQAQEELAGDQLRALGRQRAQLVTGLVARARELARAAGRRPGGDAFGEVESTLRAALADPDLALRVLSGRLTTAVSTEGFGPQPTDAAGSRAVTQPTSASQRAATSATAGSTPQQRADERRRATELRKAERDLDLAEERLLAAEAASQRADSDAAHAAEVLAAADQRAAWLRSQLAQAEAEVRTVRAASTKAALRARSAAATLEQARDRVDGARARADLL